MYRITSHILSVRSILHCRPAAELQIKTISKTAVFQKYKKATERDTCPPPPPPPSPTPKDDRLFWGAMAVLLMTGGFAYYAKQSPEIRDWLTLHASWFDDLIAVVYEENMTYREFAEQCIDDLKKYIREYTDGSPKQCSLDEERPGHVQDIKSEKSSKRTEICKISKEDDEKPECKVLPPPVITKNICEIEECVKNLGDVVVNNYWTSKEACAYYNKLIEEKMMDFSMPALKIIHAAQAERDALLKKSNEIICEASIGMDDLTRYLECGVQAPPDSIKAVKELIADLQIKISAERMKYQWEKDTSVALDSHVARVEELVTKYTSETKTLFSGLNYDQKKPVLNGDADLLLYHTLRYSDMLQADLCEGQSGMTERINRALKTLPQNEKDLKARKSAIEREYKKKKGEMDKEFRKRFDDLKANNDKTLKEALKTQLEKHEENLKIKLYKKEQEMTMKLNKMVAEKVAAEKRLFASQLTDMAAKLKIVEDKLNARLKAERESRRSQELYAAGASLLAATKKGDPIVNVDKELRSIEKASGDDDKLVKTVLKAIPDSVRTKGLVPESVLRERYHRMEKAALRVALVEQDGGPLPIFFLSWLQSMMLFMKLSCIPQAEIDQPPTEAAKDLDTFDLLRRARFWIERGNLAAALRYVSSLEGASRSAASTWFDAAQSHLETRLAAEAVIAHAAALGLQYL